MKNIILGLIIISMALLCTVSEAADGDGGSAGAFLRMGLGARPKAMGGAFTAVAEGSYAGYYNPGGFPRTEYKELAFSYRTLALDRKFNYIGAIVPLRPKVKSPDEAETAQENAPKKSTEKPFNAGLYLGWIHAGVDNIDARDYNGVQYGTFSNSENAFMFGFAVQPAKFISLGFTGKILYNRFPNMTQEDEALTSKGLGFDFGVLITPIENLSLGLMAKDLRSKYTWNTESVWERGTTSYDDFLKILRVGMAYRLLNDKLLVAADFEDNKKQKERFHLGVEYCPYPNIYLRAGMDVDEPTFGFGYQFQLWKFNTILDYAYVNDEVAPSSEHVISWAFRL